MILVLIAAAVVSGVLGELIDTLAIVVIVVLNAVIGFVQAWRADKAMAALQQLAAAHAMVLRAGQVQADPRQRVWCPATSCCWKLATRCPPICA
jgi:Ca2+-transporting ATPase